MDRSLEILKHARLSEPGIEIAPYFRPLVRKRDGHPVLYVDVFDATRLRELALTDPNIDGTWIDQIDEVDVVGDASNIGDAIAALGREGQFQYVVSSHNFEHLPNPIRFLQGCERALRPGGVLSMAVPDGRACFDHFRMPTRLSDWLSAYHRNISQPSAETIFDSEANLSGYIVEGTSRVGCDIRYDDPGQFVPRQTLKSAYAEYLQQLQTVKPYIDAHCTVTFGAALENMLWDLRYLGLLNFDIVEVSATQGLEFFVHLRKPVAAVALDEDAFFAARAQRLHRIARNLGVAGYGQPGPGQTTLSIAGQRVIRSAKRAVASVVPRSAYTAVRNWNRKRRGKGA